MRIYASKKQTEMLIVAMVKTYGVDDEEALKVLDNINKCLLYQCKQDKEKKQNPEK